MAPSRNDTMAKRTRQVCGGHSSVGQLGLGLYVAVELELCALPAPARFNLIYSLHLPHLPFWPFYGLHGATWGCSRLCRARSERTPTQAQALSVSAGLRLCYYPRVHQRWCHIVPALVPYHTSTGAISYQRWCHITPAAGAISYQRWCHIVPALVPYRTSAGAISHQRRTPHRRCQALPGCGGI